MEKYLIGIPWDKFEGLAGIYVTEHHLKGWRYFATYRQGEAMKPQIFQRLAAGGMQEAKGHWDWHHVVEGNHLAPLFSPAEHQRLYKGEWPTVLLHSAEEHKILNGLFRSRGTTLGLQKAGTTQLQGPERRNYLSTLYQRYQDIYSGDHILQRVAHHVIKSLA